MNSMKAGNLIFDFRYRYYIEKLSNLIDIITDNLRNIFYSS